MSLPALDVSVSSRRMSCILDGELALSRQGLLFAMRLAQEANVWLFRALWNTLDNSHFYPASAEPGAAGLLVLRADGTDSNVRLKHLCFLLVRFFTQASLSILLGGTSVTGKKDTLSS